MWITTNPSLWQEDECKSIMYRNLFSKLFITNIRTYLPQFSLSHTHSHSDTHTEQERERGERETETQRERDRNTERKREPYFFSSCTSKVFSSTHLSASSVTAASRAGQLTLCRICFPRSTACHTNHNLMQSWYTVIHHAIPLTWWPQGTLQKNKQKQQQKPTSNFSSIKAMWLVAQCIKKKAE